MTKTRMKTAVTTVARVAETNTVTAVVRVAVVAGAAWMALALALGYPHGLAAQEAGEADVSAELLSLYEADQADRQFTSPPGPDEWAEIAARDEERRNRVMELVRAGALETADDYYHAAMVLQHGQGSEDILIAHILATVAGFRGHDGGRWLSAAALDRYLHRTDEPQRLGTQYVRSSADEPWSMGEYVEWLPDAVREAYGVPPLEEQKARAEQMNQGGP